MVETLRRKGKPTRRCKMPRRGQSRRGGSPRNPGRMAGGWDRRQGQVEDRPVMLYVQDMSNRDPVAEWF